ncbi:hypothetical protein [Haloarcula sp. JP-L23]|uniref:hypothetical protein n=1 Tax=Haloarcula sp. JP-L23 TaxID=2716717 RepID=UPI00140EA1A1|nr:hypothetical protein G9465_22360 [Haloarcula sp. JP-L23]
MSSTRQSETTLEWRWNDRTENRPLPQSWATNGSREPVGDDEQPLYAIQFRAGLLLEWEVNQRTESLVAGPRRERPALRVLYVTRDGQQAIVREWDAERTASGWRPDPEFASSIARAPADCDDVAADTQESYRTMLEARYDVP